MVAFPHCLHLPWRLACTCLACMPCRDWGAVVGGVSLALGASGVTSQVGFMLDSVQPCTPFAYTLSSWPGQMALWHARRVSSRAWLWGGGHGLETLAWLGRGHSLASQCSLPINKRIPSSFQPCAAIAYLQARPFVPTRCQGDSDSKAWHFKASLLSWRAQGPGSRMVAGAAAALCPANHQPCPSGTATTSHSGAGGWLWEQARFYRDLTQSWL